MREETEGSNLKRGLLRKSPFEVTLYKALPKNSLESSEYTCRDGLFDGIKQQQPRQLKSAKEIRQVLPRRPAMNSRTTRALHIKERELSRYGLPLDEDLDEEANTGRNSLTDPHHHYHNSNKLITYMSPSILHGASPDSRITNELELMLTPEKLDQPLDDIDRTRMLSARTSASDKATTVGGEGVAGSDHEPSKRKRPHCGGMISVLMDSPLISWMIIFIPLGILSSFLGWSDSTTFCLNFLAIMPQAWLIGKATEDLAQHLGQILGGILNAWFGNVVEMLLCVAAIRANELLVVKATLIGSMLSNLLLVTGCSFLFGGFYHKVQEFSAIGASTNGSLMTLSCLCLGAPALYSSIHPDFVISQLKMSRSVSFFLIFMYIQFMVFQVYTHSFLFSDEDGENDDEEDAELSMITAIILLFGCTVCCATSSHFLIRSIEGTVNSLNISKSFIGIILLPIIGNAAEHYTAVIVACRNKMDLSLACAVGSSCQMALFVTPFTVLAGWAFNIPMALDFHALEMAILVLSVLIVTSILQDGYSNWLEGSMLVSAYVVIALMYFFENPNETLESLLNKP